MQETTETKTGDTFYEREDMTYSFGGAEKSGAHKRDARERAIS